MSFETSSCPAALVSVSPVQEMYGARAQLSVLANTWLFFLRDDASDPESI